MKKQHAVFEIDTYPVGYNCCNDETWGDEAVYFVRVINIPEDYDPEKLVSIKWRPTKLSMLCSYINDETDLIDFSDVKVVNEIDEHLCSGEWLDTDYYNLVVDFQDIMNYFDKAFYWLK